MKKAILLSLYAGAAVALLLHRGSISAWLQADAGGEHDVWVILAAFVAAVVPAIPYGVPAAIIGAKFGPVLGSAINLTVSVAAAAVLFLLVRYAFTAEQRRKAAGAKGLFRLTAFAELNPFMAILTARMLPVVPAQAVNIFAALTRMRIAPFMAATALGKIPFLVTVTLLGEQILRTPQWDQILLIAAGYLLFLGVFALATRQIRS